MIQLSWQNYATWLIVIEGVEVNKAIERAGKVYEKQFKKDFQVEEAQAIKDFLEERF